MVLLGNFTGHEHWIRKTLNRVQQSFNEQHADNESLPKSVALRLKATAFHEAGHAVMAYSLGRASHKVTVSPGKSQFGQLRLGVCQLGKGRAKSSKDLFDEEALILLAGMVPEAHFTGQYCRRGAAEDLRNVERLLCTRAHSVKQHEKLHRRLLDRTEHLLSDPIHATAIELIATELVQRETISGRAVRHFFELAKAQHKA